MKLRVENLPPPSINHYYIFGSHKFRSLSSRGRAFKQALGLVARSCGFKPLSGDVRLHIEWFRKDKRRRDLDNILKPILDSLNGIAYKDDSQIKVLSIASSFSECEALEVEVLEVLES